jgi:hypothetical protein
MSVGPCQSRPGVPMAGDRSARRALGIGCRVRSRAFVRVHALSKMWSIVYNSICGQAEGRMYAMDQEECNTLRIYPGIPGT